MQMPYEELQAQMHRSTFCLLPPGGTASSRRLTDVVLSGCIPVFIGPPWHAMPLARHLDYTTFAVFVNARSMRSVASSHARVAHTSCHTVAGACACAWWSLPCCRDEEQLFRPRPLSTQMCTSRG